MSKIVGIEMPMYMRHQSLMNSENNGKTINPTDQKNSNTNVLMTLAAPFVMSPTLGKRKCSFCDEFRAKVA